MTMTLVQTVTVGPSGAASIEFTGIAGTATDLLILFSTRSDTAGSNLGVPVRFNNDTNSANYASRALYGDGGTAGSFTSTMQIASPGTGNTANTFNNGSLYISNYASSSAKSVSADYVYENNATTANQYIWAGTWSGTAAITSIKLTGSVNFAQYSTASLYTITKGSGGATVS